MEMEIIAVLAGSESASPWRVYGVRARAVGCRQQIFRTDGWQPLLTNSQGGGGHHESGMFGRVDARSGGCWAARTVTAARNV